MANALSVEFAHRGFDAIRPSYQSPKKTPCDLDRFGSRVNMQTFVEGGYALMCIADQLHATLLGLSDAEGGAFVWLGETA
jgi:hypothetical protein